MRIAILGGTFDPIHNGHLAAAHAVADSFEVDEVQFVPAFSPPHKSRSEITSPFHRFAMTALATAPFDRFRVSTVEVDTLGPRYSVQTLERMHRLYPGSFFLFITGTDMFQEIEEWKDYRRLLELASFAVVNRPGYEMREDLKPFETVERRPAHPLGEEPRVYYLPRLQQEISSTRIREELKEGYPADRWVPPPVLAYIAKHGLYG